MLAFPCFQPQQLPYLRGMNSLQKSQADILQKLGIAELNPMQVAAKQAIHASSEVVLLSPTGTGKTLAFLLPIVAELHSDSTEIQALVLVPSRELAIQIEQVARNMGSGFKVNAVYGGRPVAKDKAELKHRPAILIGTPGRVADHFRRATFSTDHIQTLVLDEFDKSLEIGFEDEMKEIIGALRLVNKKVLTSATQEAAIPAFVGVHDPVQLDYLATGDMKLTVKAILSPSKDKLETLVDALSHFGNEPGIIFCNFKDSIQRVSDYLTKRGIRHGCFHGGMEQQDRERSLIQFRNGSYQLIVATDLAARGIDVPEIKFILHYHLPMKEQEFIHRNGRTARMNRAGTAYVLHYEKDRLPDFIGAPEVEKIKAAHLPNPSPWVTLFISGGRRDKISKGDIAGFFFKIGQLEKEQLGAIEIKHDCAFVAVQAKTANTIVAALDNQRLKKKKVRVSLI